MVYVKRRDTFHVDSSPDLHGEVTALVLRCQLDYIMLYFLADFLCSQHTPQDLFISIIAWSVLPSVTLYNCSVGRSDCSRCHTADHKYGCVWCGGAHASCLYSDSCSEPVQQTCPAPVIHSVSTDLWPPLYCVGDPTHVRGLHSQFLFTQIEPLSGLLEGGTTVTISGSNLGQKATDILHSVSVAGVPCTVIPSLYEVSSRYRPTPARCVQSAEVLTFHFKALFESFQSSSTSITLIKHCQGA